MPKRELIAYNPKKILDYIQREGPTSSRDLQKIFGYDAHAARIVISTLQTNGFIEGYDYKVELWETPSEKFPHRAYRTYVLTERGKTVKDCELTERIIVLESMPMLGSYLKDALNETLGSLAGANIKDPEEILKLPKEELERVMKESADKVIETFDPVELSRLEEELESLKSKRK
jgi:DNA-binding Lrp family transcriptional regulator